jgi:Protein of unknown function (DUF2380)
LSTEPGDLKPLAETSMFGANKYRTRAARRSGSRSRWTHEFAHRFALAAVALWCWTGYAAADDVPAASTAPIKIAVFPFELEDFSAAAGQGSSPDETSYMAQSTEEAKKQLLQSGRYSLIDTAGADIGAAKGQGLRNCRGCEAAIALKLGADQSLIGVVTKISMAEYVVDLQVRDARTGAVVSRFTTGLRMGAHDAWFRGVRSLMKNHMLASQ